MAAFKYQVAYELEKNIGTMFQRLKKVSGKTISHENFLSLFVPREHRDTFRSMADLSETGNGRRAVYRWNDLNVNFTLRESMGNNPPPFPREMYLQPDADEALVAEISTWAANGGDASGDFGRVRALFKKLNDTLTKGQIRFVWPSILAICNADTANSVAILAGGDLQDAKASGGIALPRGLLLACRKTAATLAMTSLIPHDVVSKDPGEVLITAVDGQAYSEADLGDYAGHT